MFVTPDSDRIRRSLLEYEQSAVAEWPRAVNGERFPEAEEALKRLYSAYEQVRPSNETQKTFLTNSLTTLNELSRSRTERLIQVRADVGPPWSLWVVIFLTSGLVLGSAIIYGVEKTAMHYPMVATVGVLIAANLFLVLELSHPFIGEIAASPEPLRETIRFVQQSPW